MTQPDSGGTAVVLLNLGTPDAPTAPALRRYLGEFLGDRRVVEIPRLVWLPLLYGVILPLRASRSAAKYATIWQSGGSPLATGTAALAEALQAELDRRGHRVAVRHAMRYGQPSTPAVLDDLADRDHLLALPLYPQFSATTTASSLDAVMAWFGRLRRQPALRTVRSYAADRGYIEALARSVRRAWEGRARGELLVMSFHGLPQRNVKLGDPYADECRQTAEALAAALGLAPEQWRMTFQSRFGRQAWLQPYTEPTLRELARAGTRSVDVICPGFAVDCLETLEEVAMECKAAFLSAGGQNYRYIPCLNDDPAWVAALADRVEHELAGWPTRAAADSRPKLD